MIDDDFCCLFFVFLFFISIMNSFKPQITPRGNFSRIIKANKKSETLNERDPNNQSRETERDREREIFYSPSESKTQRMAIRHDIMSNIRADKSNQKLLSDNRPNAKKEKDSKKSSGYTKDTD